MFKTRTFIEENHNSVIFAIVTNNLKDVYKLINNKNFNNILDDTTGFTALHYAISSPNVNNDIIKHILSVGANPKDKIKNQEIDSFDLAIRYNKRYLFEYFNKLKDDNIIELTEKNINLQNNINKIEDNNNYLLKSIDNYNKKINNLNELVKLKDEQIKTLKRKNEDSEIAFNNLLKKIKK